MSTACSEVTVDELSDLDLDKTPECQIKWRNTAPGCDAVYTYACAKPAAVRVTITCHECRCNSTLFLCRECYDDAVKGELHCSACFMDGNPKPSDFSFREI